MPITLPLASTSLTSGLPDATVVGTGLSLPPGIEAVLEYRSNYLNMRQWLDTILITEIDGLADADVRDAREVNPGAHGETFFNAYYGGRTITLTGRIRAQSLNKMRDMQQGLRQMFNDISTEYPLIFHAPDPLNDCMIYCKKNAPMAMKEAQVNFQHTRDFMLTLRASNPRIMSVYTSYTTWQNPGSATQGSVTALNNGNYTAQPQLQITGPVTNPEIAFVDAVTQKSMGVIKFVAGTTIPSGSTFYIDIAKRSIVDQTGANRFSALHVDSAWPELVPGTNTVTITGTSMTSESSLTLMWRHSWL